MCWCQLREEASGCAHTRTHHRVSQAGQLLCECIRPETEVIKEIWAEELTTKVGTHGAQELASFPKRDPVLCILGHVDHGKTTLLDFLRKTTVAENEAGGITQSIGAFEVTMPESSTHSRLVVFDTPGHAAFTGMRQRGANVVDVAILVVAAADGIKPQTRESLAIIRREKLPFVVALNKCDRPEANPEMVKKQLAGLGVYIHMKWKLRSLFQYCTLWTQRGSE